MIPERWLGVGEQEIMQTPKELLHERREVKALLRALDTANDAKNKAQKFKMSYLKISLPKSLTEITDLADSLSRKWSRANYEKVHDLAESLINYCDEKLDQLEATPRPTRKRKAEEKPLPRDAKRPRTALLAKAVGAGMSFFESAKTAARKAATGTKYAFGTASALLTAIQAVRVGGRIMSGDFGGAMEVVTDPRFYPTLLTTGSLTALSSRAERMLTPSDAAAEKAVASFSRDLTQEARENKLYPAIGRVEEINKVLQGLVHVTKPNVVLAGPPGVGKTAIVEGLSQLINEGNVPPQLQGKRIISLNMGDLVAGTQYRGQFEKKLQEVMEQAKDPNVILFIDEIHTVIGAGAAEGGALDAANILKPHLDRGEIRCIGATTLDEYRRLKQDPAFDRRFNIVEVKEPSNENARAMIRARKEKYETHYGVRITEAAITQAVTLSQEHTKERFLPDKAFDLIEQAASLVSTQLTSTPVEIQTLEAELVDANLELSNLKREVSRNVRENIVALQEKIASLEESLDTKTAQWKQDREHIQHIERLRSELTQRALPKQERQQLQQQIEQLRSELTLLQDEVNEEVITSLLQERMDIS